MQTWCGFDKCSLTTTPPTHKSFIDRIPEKYYADDFKQPRLRFPIDYPETWTRKLAGDTWPRRFFHHGRRSVVGGIKLLLKATARRGRLYLRFGFRRWLENAAVVA